MDQNYRVKLNIRAYMYIYKQTNAHIQIHTCAHTRTHKLSDKILNAILKYSFTIMHKLIRKQMLNKTR